jgi:hypothetical protein
VRFAILLAKFGGYLAGWLVLLLALYAAFALLRKSIPFVFRGDLERLAASGPLNSQALATEICGTPADFLGSPDNEYPATALPHATLVSWWPMYPMEGTASARIVGVGVSRLTSRATTGACKATITFRYRCAWVDNGRALVLETQFLDSPEMVRP